MKKKIYKIASEILKESVLPDQNTKEISTTINLGLSAESLKILLETIRQTKGFASIKEKLPVNFSAKPAIISFSIGINPTLKTTATQFENNLKNEISKKHFRFEVLR